VQAGSEHEDKNASSPPAIGTRQMSDDPTPRAEAKKKDRRVATNLRLTRDQWRRVHELALDEETTVQELAIRGLSRLLEERGLPRL
jgi:hypothetical protein